MNEQDENPPPENTDFRFDRADLEDQEVQQIHAQIRREKDEPQEGFAAPPMIMVFLCMFLCLWGGYEISNGSARFRWDVFDPNYDPTSSLQPGAVVFDPMARGRRVYNNCIACHQANGEGLPGIYPPLANSDWMPKSPEILVRIVLNGMSGPIVVNGNTYNSVMSGFSNLSDRDIASVLTYVRNTWGNALPAIDETEVAAIRAAVGGRSTPYTANELLQQFGN
jgi:mono/diheme cytochrome c family protein